MVEGQLFFLPYKHMEIMPRAVWPTRLNVTFLRQRITFDSLTIGLSSPFYIHFGAHFIYGHMVSEPPLTANKKYVCAESSTVLYFQSFQT